MKKSPLDACEEYCQKNGIIKFSGDYYDIRNAILIKNHALSYYTIYECIRDWKYENIEEFYKLYKWCFPYQEYFISIRLNKETYYWILYRKIEKVFYETLKK